MYVNNVFNNVFFLVHIQTHYDEKSTRREIKWSPLFHSIYYFKFRNFQPKYRVYDIILLL